MTHHENQAIRFLKAQRERLEKDVNELMAREVDLYASLAANAGAQTEKLSALNDIDQLLNAIDPSAE